MPTTPTGRGPRCATAAVAWQLAASSRGAREPANGLGRSRKPPAPGLDAPPPGHFISPGRHKPARCAAREHRTPGLQNGPRPISATACSFASALAKKTRRRPPFTTIQWRASFLAHLFQERMPGPNTRAPSRLSEPTATHLLRHGTDFTGPGSATESPLLLPSPWPCTLRSGIRLDGPCAWWGDRASREEPIRESCRGWSLPV